MKVIIYTHPDGAVDLGLIARDGGFTTGIERRVGAGMSLDDAIAAVAEKAIAEAGWSGVTWRIGDSTDLPGGLANGTYDRSFRKAFVASGRRVIIDMDRAREAHKAVLRAVREPLLSALDVEYQRADEAGDTTGKVAVAQKKQALRDVTADPRIAAAQTPEELKAVWPDALT